MVEVFPFLAAFLLIKRLQKSLTFSPLRPKWRSLLNVGLWSTVVVWGFAFGYLDDVAQYLLGSSLLAGIVIFADKEPDFKNLHSFFHEFSITILHTTTHKYQAVLLPSPGALFARGEG